MTAEVQLQATASKSFLRRVYARLPQPPSTNYMFKVPANPYDLLPADAIIFDIGSKSARGLYRVGGPPRDAKVVCVDIAPGAGVDLVADAHDMHMVPDNSVDCVVTISMLEHVRYPQKIVKEIHRILKPGGIIYVSVPFVFPFHSDPYDFYRFSCQGVAVLCEDFERIDSGYNRGPASTMCELLVIFFAMLLSFNSKPLYTANLYVLRWLLSWLKYLDVFMGHMKMSRVIHTGSYFLGRKKHPHGTP
jgi:SAM-dependent methyltransferase